MRSTRAAPVSAVPVGPSVSMTRSAACVSPSNKRSVMLTSRNGTSGNGLRYSACLYPLPRTFGRLTATSRSQTETAWDRGLFAGSDPGQDRGTSPGRRESSAHTGSCETLLQRRKARQWQRRPERTAPEAGPRPGPRQAAPRSALPPETRCKAPDWPPEPWCSRQIPPRCRRRAARGGVPEEHLQHHDPEVQDRHQRDQHRADHAAGIRASAIPAYQLEPKGMALSSKL